MKILTISLAAIILNAGCAAQSQKMIPSDLSIENKHPFTISLTMVGGRETNPLWTSQISNEAYVDALAESILMTGLFKSVIKGEGSDYILDITLNNITQPIIGLGITINMETEWSLTNTVSHQQIWKELVFSSYTAKLTDAFIGAERLQKANEGAARENIKQGIILLSMVNLY